MPSGRVRICTGTVGCDESVGGRKKGGVMLVAGTYIKGKRDDEEGRNLERRGKTCGSHEIRLW